MKVNREVHRATEKILRAFNSSKFLLEIHDYEHSRHLYVLFLAATASCLGAEVTRKILLL